MKKNTPVEVLVDGHSFNATHYSGWSEKDFIKDMMPSVDDRIGTVDQKTEFLKQAHAEIQKAVPAEKAVK